MHGVQGAGFINVAVNDVEGGQGAGFANVSRGSMDGIQGAGFLNVTLKDAHGVQGAGFLNLTGGNMEGGQGAGFLKRNQRRFQRRTDCWILEYHRRNTLWLSSSGLPKCRQDLKRSSNRYYKRGRQH